MLLDLSGQYIIRKYGHIFCILGSFWEELVNKMSNKFDAFLLNRRVKGVIEHSLQDFFDEPFDVSKAVYNFWSFFLCSLRDCPNRKYSRWKDIIDKDWTLYHLNPVRTDGVFRVVSEDFLTTKNSLFWKYFIHYINSIIFTQLIFIKVA